MENIKEIKWQSTWSYTYQLIETLKALDAEVVESIIELFITTRALGGRVFTFGNGGSAATAIHFANDLNKFPGINRTIEAHSLTNLALLTAFANDVSYDAIFYEQLKLFAKDGDIAFGISCSGTSGNVIRGLGHAKNSLGMSTVLLTGDKLSSLADMTLYVPNDDIRIQEDVHLAVCHMIAGELRDRP
jgi:D-sedoheptulose 7-phosphate isomerase